MHGFVAELGAFPHAIEPVRARRARRAHEPPAARARERRSSTRPARRASRATSRSRTPAGSLRDMTRIAGANPRLWREIFLDNADAVRASLAEHRRRIEEVEDALDRRDGEFIGALDRRGRAEPPADARRRLRRCRRRSQRIQVHVADRPNVLAEITQAFGAARINISDFELDHVSPEQGGTLMLDRQRRGGSRPRRRRCSRARATASSSPRWWTMKVEPAAALRGAIAVPGVKGISQRAVLLGALADGESRITGFGRAADTESAITVARAIGAEVQRGRRRGAPDPRRRPPRRARPRRRRSTAGTPAP